jgi:hypothetical protein
VLSVSTCFGASRLRYNGLTRAGLLNGKGLFSRIFFDILTGRHSADGFWVALAAGGVTSLAVPGLLTPPGGGKI